MSWSLRLVTAPSSEVLTLAQAKAQSRVDFTDEDSYITSLTVAARASVEEDLSRSLITQTWELGLPCFPREDRILLPRGPLQSVTSVIYTDSALNSFTMTAGTDYLVDQYADLAEIVLPFGKVWPTAVLSTMRPVVIRFVAGYGDTSAAVPTPISLAMLQLVGDWYENREAVNISRTSSAIVELPNAYKNLLATYRLRYPGPFRQG
jgi:uncharacterized phiE125 gp8 family phage protein